MAARSRPVWTALPQAAAITSCFWIPTTCCWRTASRRMCLVHLSIRIPVGFTCSDLLQVVDGRIVLGGHSALSGYILNSGPSLAAVRPATTAIWQNWAGSLDRSVSDRIYSIDMSCREWPWSATSAFFFRRDALNLWVKTPGLADIRRSTDGFFGRAINAVTGSVLIDECLGTLRVHGANNFNKHPQLNNMRNYDLEKDKTVPHRLAILEELTRDPARFPFYSPELLKNALSPSTRPIRRPMRPPGREAPASPACWSSDTLRWRRYSAKGGSSAGCSKEEFGQRR